MSRLPTAVGLCQSDIPDIAAYVNSAQKRLLQCPESGEEGWYGTWAEVIFSVTQTNPYITLPRGFARLEMANVCNRPVPIQNQFYEYLQFGNGRLPALKRTCPGSLNFYARNRAITFTDLSGTAQRLMFTSTNPAQDAGKRILVQGLDNNNVVPFSQDVLNNVNGVFYTLAAQPSTSLNQWNSITGIQKDVTFGFVQVFQVDPVTGVQTLILTMEPTETTALYQRYYLNPAPLQCCNTTLTPGVVQVSAIAKLDLVPVITDTDYCLIQNLEALIEECQAIRYSTMDNVQSKSMAKAHHRNAVGYLNGEITHFLGKESPAVEFAPFGSAHLHRKRIGSLI